MFGIGRKKPLSLRQKKTYGYLRVIVGIYLCYTAYQMQHDLRAGIKADNPTLVIVMAVLFAVFGILFTVTGFIKAYKITGEELEASQGETESEQQENPEEEKD